MGNTSGKIHGLHMSTCQTTTMILDSEDVFKQAAELDGTEVDVPDGVVDGLEADVLASAGCRDGDPGRVPSDAAVRAHEPCLEVRWVDEGRRPWGQAARRGAIA